MVQGISRWLLAAVLCASVAPALAQAPAATSQPKRATQRLYMRDGSFQVVTEYHMKGATVRYYSAERAKWEEVPTELVDISRTQHWNAEHAELPKPIPPHHASPAAAESSAVPVAPADPAHPVVAPDLKLPSEGYLLALDVWRNTNELVPLRQEAARPAPVAPPKPKKEKHDKKGLAPLPAPPPTKPAVQQAPIAARVEKANGRTDIRLRDTHAQVQFHIAEPIFFVRGTATNHSWVIVRVLGDARRGDRYVSPITAQTLQGIGVNALGFQAEPTPGGQWTRLKPDGRIPIGEYALVQVLSPDTYDAHVWDFGVDPTANNSDDAIFPEGVQPPER